MKLSEPNGALRRSLVSLLAGELRGGSQHSLARILKRAQDSLCAHDLAQTLRNLDRAWRAFPDEALRISPLYARALMLDGGDYHAVLSLAQVALGLSPDPEIAAIQVVALLRAGRSAEAVEHLERALTEYCVMPNDVLAFAADEVVAHPSIDVPGWTGRGPTLVAENRLSGPADGRGLLGGSAHAPGDFRLDGRTVNQGLRVTAWARLGWRPAQAPRLRFVDQHRHSVEVQSEARPRSGWRWTYRVNLAATALRGDCIEVSAQLPDGRWQVLPDAPLLLQAPLPKPVRSSGVRPSGPPQRRHIDVIIPVYGNRSETLACIESALRTTVGLARLVIVDDASEDRELAAELDRLAQDGRVTLLRNDKNLGFAGAVNRGLAHGLDRDAVLLNTDTLVFGDWLMRLQAAAYSQTHIGTVTPLTNNGTIASYPEASGGAALTPTAAAALHALAAATHPGKRVQIPVGVGFCLYLRRDCLNAVGSLDVAVFGKGYGEETDFCLRAALLGWTHQLAADVYVSHAGGLSFGARRAALLDRSQRLLNLRHPGYHRSILRFLARDPVHGVRRDLDEQRLRSHTGRHVLIVTLALSGGVDRFVKERCLQLRALGFTPILLRPVKPRDLRRCELSADGLDMPSLQYSIPRELAALQRLLDALSFEFIEIQHFLHLDPRVIEAVRRLPSPYDVFVHDYAWLCPRVTLIDNSGRYCGEPALKVCETCVQRHGSDLVEKLSVQALRARSTTWLNAARRVIAPSGDTATRLLRHFVGLDVEVRPHAAADLAVMPEGPLPRAHPGPVRVALLGAIGAHKGYQVLLDCARDARARRLPIEFVVIGFTENDAPLLATGKVFITGPYIDGEAPHLIARERPDVAWLPSVWPETWSYTLDHALSARLAVAAFDLGAIAERLRDSPHALLLPLTMKSHRINDALLDFVDGMPLEGSAAMSFVKSLPAPRHEMASIDALQWRGISMTKSANGKAPAEGHDTGLSASVQVLPLAAGLYLFSVTAGKAQTSSGDGQLMLPAMHVGLGPGVRAEQVEFLASPSTHGAWLFSATDQLVTRVNGNGATLVLTSVRAPTGDVLSIKVERLDARIDTAEVRRPAAAARPAKIVAPIKAADAPLSLLIAAHVRARGDMQFRDAPWSGRVGPGLWIESFAVLPLEHLSAHDIEYKGLTGSGFETPWLSDNAACGTKGMGVPLVGFALRLRPSSTTAAYDCEYSGYFQSGLTVGPMRNGAPCRSNVANDPLEGIQVRLVKRPKAAASAALAHATAAPGEPKRVIPKAKMPVIPAVKPGKRVALAR